jgi:hypothetical protein
VEREKIERGRGGGRGEQSMTAKLAEDGMKLGTCENCGDSNIEVFKDNNRCQDCDGQFYPCSICKTDQSEDDHCRHIFQGINDYEWKGSGAWADPSLKKPLFRLFNLMPEGFAVDLRAAIKSGKFYTWLMAPLIGDGGLLELNGMPYREDQSMLFYWGQALIEIGQGEHAEETGEGYRWIVSLYEKETLKANRQTIKWIDEYLQLRTTAGPTA